MILKLELNCSNICKAVSFMCNVWLKWAFVYSYSQNRSMIQLQQNSINDPYETGHVLNFPLFRIINTYTDLSL
jgi:hypothetical protein